MIATQDLEKIFALVIASGWVKGEKPVSLIVVSDRPESGKTEIASKFIGTKKIIYLSDATAFALWRDFHEPIARGEVKHLIIPEFLAPLSRHNQTVQSFIATLQILIEEGIFQISTGFLKPIKLEHPTTVGAIVCLPRDAFSRNRIDWEVSGFLSRFMVASYSYNGNTVRQIFDSIAEREYLQAGKTVLNLPDTEQEVDIPPDIAKAARDYAIVVTKQARVDGKCYGFREFKNMLRMIAANVILEGNGRREATMKDFGEIVRLSYLLNEDFNELHEVSNA